MIRSAEQSTRPEIQQEETGHLTLAAAIDDGRLSSQAPNGAWEVLAAVPDFPAPIAPPPTEHSREISRSEEIRAGLGALAMPYRRLLDCAPLPCRRQAQL